MGCIYFIIMAIFLKDIWNNWIIQASCELLFYSAGRNITKSEIVRGLFKHEKTQFVNVSKLNNFVNKSEVDNLSRG